MSHSLLPNQCLERRKHPKSSGPGGFDWMPPIIAAAGRCPRLGSFFWPGVLDQHVLGHLRVGDVVSEQSIRSPGSHPESGLTM